MEEEEEEEEEQDEFESREMIDHIVPFVKNSHSAVPRVNNFSNGK